MGQAVQGGQTVGSKDRGRADSLYPFGFFMIHLRMSWLQPVSESSKYGVVCSREAGNDEEIIAQERNHTQLELRREESPTRYFGQYLIQKKTRLASYLPRLCDHSYEHVLEVAASRIIIHIHFSVELNWSKLGHQVGQFNV